LRSIRVFSLLAVCLAVAVAMPAPALSSLISTQFGFPVIVQNGQSVAFSSDVATSADLETLSIDFPMFEGIMGDSGMPAIGSGPSIGPGVFNSNMGSLFDFSRFKFH
jgi:hypothetical protein